SPAGRRKLAAEIAKQMRRSQQQRIKQQKAPDGTPYQARKRQPLRAKKGRIKRTMFQKLRTNRYMKARGRDDAAVVEFTGKVQRIAQIHQLGLKDRPNPHAQDVQYPERQLLGVDFRDNLLIEKLVIEHLN
ncbi:TPA: phage virion morphogenesis protein, partial [Escherichia coli]|nr:phage virion morphogenesis protein [Escherichia coli]